VQILLPVGVLLARRGTDLCQSWPCWRLRLHAAAVLDPQARAAAAFCGCGHNGENTVFRLVDDKVIQFSFFLTVPLSEVNFH
jgi:hypothetical protein